MPCENLLSVVRRRIKQWGWDADVSLRLYVDDGIVSTAGHLDSVVMIHQWVCGMVIDWVKKILKKQLAEEKSSCIVSCRALKERLQNDMAAIGIVTVLEGEILGVDYAAGAPAVNRRVRTKRLAKARARKPRLRWWKKHGGDARPLARGGVNPMATFGGEVTGWSNAGLRDIRRIHACATQVRCKGASLSARLAIGGIRYQEFDPAVLQANPPLIASLKKDLGPAHFEDGFHSMLAACSEGDERGGENQQLEQGVWSHQCCVGA